MTDTKIKIPEEAAASYAALDLILKTDPTVLITLVGALTGYSADANRVLSRIHEIRESKATNGKG